MYPEETYRTISTLLFCVILMGFIFFGRLYFLPYLEENYENNSQEIVEENETSDSFEAKEAERAIEDGEYIPHEHSFGEWTVSKEATTEEEGVMTRVCECGKEEHQIIPRVKEEIKVDRRYLEDVEEDSGSSNFILIGLTILGSIIFLCVASIAIYKKKEQDKLDSLREFMESKREEKEVIEEAKPAKDTFEVFCDKLSSSISLLESTNRQVNDMDINDSVRKSLEVLRNISKNITNENYSKGNLKHLNDLYIDNYSNFLIQYRNLENYDDQENVLKTLKELKDTIIKFEAIFNSILNEAIGPELLQASIDSKVIVDFAKQNGLMQKNGLNF